MKPLSLAAILVAISVHLGASASAPKKSSELRPDLAGASSGRAGGQTPAPKTPARPASTTPQAPSAAKPPMPAAVSHAAPGFGAAEQTAMVKQYCTGCHNDRAKAGQLTLASFDAAAAASPEHLVTTEKMIRKLRAGMMPPATAKRPPAEQILALAEAVTIKFTVKTRLGFASTGEFDHLLSIFAKHQIDALTVHARTVAQLYRLPVHYDRIRQAAETMRCPVIANGHVYDAQQAQTLLARTGARGLMIGRGVIRSPWLFNQIRQQLRGDTVTQPTGREVWAYIRALWDAQSGADKPEKVQCERMKKFLNYLGEGVPGLFLHRIRRAQTAAEFHRICADFLDHDRAMALWPAELIEAS